MITVHTLGGAIDFATEAHGRQTRITTQGLEPYVNHPIRVALAVHKYGRVAQVVAALHDVLEDTPVTRDDLGAVVGHYVADCVNALTKPEEQSYEDFILSIQRYNEGIVTMVKLADLHDNIESSKGTKFDKHIPRWESALVVLGG